MRMNRERVEALRTRIAELDAAHCEMDAWTCGPMFGNGEPLCGTTACIAGHALAMKYGMFNASVSLADAGIEAAEYLGFDSPVSSSHTDVPLFYIGMWPERYLDIAEDEGDQKAMLAILDALLDGTLVLADDGRLENRIG